MFSSKSSSREKTKFAKFTVNKTLKIKKKEKKKKIYWGVPEARGWGRGGEVDEGGQNVEVSSYKINKS